ncbi:MAG TPA: HlyD family efflux transporter periplasmic adaptor subunit [Alphaproteobacteria bacterium]|jgi:HlyD family secretion protein|nr:HlyD family efflux transporter periplasmic adaptor subunit [Alphaproteobacteria bacterium]
MSRHLGISADRSPKAFDSSPEAPAVVIAPPGVRPRRPNRKLGRYLALAAAGAAAFGAGLYWWEHRSPGIPAGIAWSNGRIEADEIDIQTKFPGRLAALYADEGDHVVRGQILAEMDTRDQVDTLHRDEATARQVEHTLDEARANIDQQQTTVELARKQIARTQSLLKKDYATHELYDQQRQRLDGALAAQTAATARLEQAQQATAAARAQVALDQTNIADNVLFAPSDGRIEYRISKVGEVLGSGGKVFTMLDSSYVYMDVYLPMAEVGKIQIGSEARVVLDALPKAPIPARVSFLANQAQFTPKTVETKSERDKLMFRVRVRLDERRAREFMDSAGIGLPGLTYIRIDPNVAWPSALQPKS